MLDSADMPALDNTVTFCMTDSYTVHPHVNSSKQKSTKECLWPLLSHQPDDEQVPNPSKDLAQMHDPNDTLH